MPTPAVSALVLGAFCLPLLLAALARERALRGPAEVEARWFCFARRIHTLIQLGPIAWLVVVMQAVPRTPALLAGLREPSPLAAIAVFVALIAPVGLLPALLGVIANDVALRLGTTEIGRRETLRRSAWLVAAAAAPAVGLALGALAIVRRDALAATAWFVVGVAVASWCLARHRRGLGLTPHAVTHGELRDRLFALAARAGVTLRQLYVLPMRRLRMANAFAVSGQLVMVTDLLLDRLDRDEVDAVMAHEIAHLRRGDPVKLLAANASAGAVPFFALQGLGWGGIAAGVVAGLLAAMAYSRRIERRADRAALELGADPGALISGLARLARLSHVPLRWSRWTGWWLTHPSIAERAGAIGRAGGLDPAEVERCLAVREARGAHYALPAVMESGERLFSTSFKNRTVLRNALALLGIAVLVPAAVFSVARGIGIGAEYRFATALVALLLAPAACVLAFDFLAVQSLIGLRRALAARLGVAGGPASGWQFAGFAPHREPRVYEGFSNWDVGFVRLTGDALEFAGEEVRFSLAADRVVECSVAEDVPAWIPTRAARVHWLDDAGDEHSFRLAPVEAASLHAAAGRSDRLAAAIDAWRTSPRTVATTHSPGLPPVGEVTCAHPRTLAPASAFVPFTVLVLLVALIACMAAGLPLLPFAGPGFVEIVLVAFATQVFLMIPAWRYRDAEEREGSPADATGRRAA